MERDEALKLLGLDASATDHDLQEACRQLAAELSERMVRAETDAQRARYQSLIREIERSVAAVRMSITSGPSEIAEPDAGRQTEVVTEHSRVRKIAVLLSSLVLVAVGAGIVLRVMSTGRSGAPQSASRATPDESDRQKAAEPARQQSPAPAGTAQGQTRDEPAAAAAAKDLRDRLQRAERELSAKVAEAQTRLDNCQQLLRRARGDDQRKSLEDRRRELAAELDLMRRLASLSQAHMFNPSVRAELRSQFADADGHVAAGRCPEALASYERLKSRLEESLSWLDRVESVLRRQATLSREIEQLRTALGPQAQSLDVVQSALGDAASQMRTGDEEITAGRVVNALSAYQSAAARLADVKTRAVEGLLAHAQTYDRDGQPSAAVLLLNELLTLSPTDQAAVQLRHDIVSRRMSNSLGMELVFIPPGEFLMGSPGEELDRDDDEHRRNVRLASGFYLGTTEVTQSQWVAVMGRNPSNSRGDNLPVEQVTWDEALEFCAALSRKEGRSYRLPTEAEWEYACRAGSTTPFSFGDTISTDEANYDGDFPYGEGIKGVFRDRTTPAASFPPNAWGLYDMHGNVWEWCLDEVAAVPEMTATPQRGTRAASTGPQPGTEAATPQQRAGRGAATAAQPAASEPPPPAHVLRGGSWRSRPGHCRCANRVIDIEDSRLGNIGFRVVLESR